VKTLAIHCHCDVCSTHGGHSAGCRTSWVCLQHHATVVTSNGVTVRGSKFPPNVSKHCQHQHSATIPAVVLSKVLLPQSNITRVFVHSHSSLLYDVSSGLPKNINHNIAPFTTTRVVVIVVVVTVTAAIAILVVVIIFC